jgi:hypothetical protein
VTSRLRVVVLALAVPRSARFGDCAQAESGGASALAGGGAVAGAGKSSDIKDRPRQVVPAMNAWRS